MRLAVLVTDQQQLVSHWNRGAEELFGYGLQEALGRSPAQLLGLPPKGAGVFVEPEGKPGHAWTSTCRVTHRDGTPRDVTWWTYPIAVHDRPGLLAFAADSTLLRASGPRFVIGDPLTDTDTSSPQSPDSCLRVLYAEPVLAQAESLLEAEQLGRRLAELLPRMGPRINEHIIRQVLAHGYPTLDMTITARVPIAPYWGRSTRIARTGPALTNAGSSDLAAHCPNESPENGLETAAAGERLSFLNEVSTRIGSTLDLQRTVIELAEVAVPRFADFAGVHLLDRIVTEEEFPISAPDASPVCRRVAVQHNDEPGRWDDTIPIDEVFAFPPETPFARCMTTGKPVCIPRVDETMASRIASQFETRDLRPLIRGRSLLIVPLIARGTVLGFMVLLRKPDRPAFDDMDTATAEEMAGRASLCMDNARLYRLQARTASHLQRSMLPQDLPDLPGIEIAHRYLPGTETAEVGGDWFDAIPLPSSRAALVVGDVMGHGLHSAAVMGQLRTALQTLATLDLPPDHVLRNLDDLAERLGESHLATCVYAVYDPVVRRCAIANAGHVPPVLVHPDGRSEVLNLPPGAPIGVGDISFESFETVEFDVPDGSALVLCTDGLVEVRGQDIEIGLAGLCTHLTDPMQPLQNVCEAIIRALPADDRRDDIALLIARFHGIAEDNVVSWTLDRNPREVGRARALVRSTLEGWGLQALADVTQLLVSELVTNALRHSSQPIGLRLMKANTLLCEVTDALPTLPTLRRFPETDESGRGLLLVSQLSQHWGASRTSTGKIVWFQQTLPNP
ncbi:MAG: SpoIIE family protein phosphatase [Egibacteraceae bacterium]